MNNEDIYKQYYDKWATFIYENNKLKQYSTEVGEVENLKVPEKYLQIWETISKPVQLRKATNHGLTEERTHKCLKELQKRAYFLVQTANFFDVKNILEVGTAEGYQFFSFAEYSKKSKGHVWSCDIKDVRHKDSIGNYPDQCTFHLGDSASLSSKIEEESKDTKIDLFYIDGAHDRTDVVKDVANLRRLQSENPIWIFDDFDTRFGCYEDIKFLCSRSKEYKVYSVGETASGKPNHQAMIFGKL